MQRARASHVSDAAARADRRDGARAAGDVARAQDVHAQMLAAMDTALSDRESASHEDSTGINGIMWFVSFRGAFITVGLRISSAFERTSCSS